MRCANCASEREPVIGIGLGQTLQCPECEWPIGVPVPDAPFCAICGGGMATTTRIPASKPFQAAQGTHAGPMSGSRGRIEIRDRDTHPPVIGRATPKKVRATRA
jgi:hypothetical protein